MGIASRYSSDMIKQIREYKQDLIVIDGMVPQVPEQSRVRCIAHLAKLQGHTP